MNSSTMASIQSSTHSPAKPFVPVSVDLLDTFSHRTYLFNTYEHGSFQKSQSTLTTKFETIPEPLLPDEMYISLLPFVEFLRVFHLVGFSVARAQKMCDFHRALKIFDIDPLMHCHEAIYFGASIDILYARER